MNSTISNKYKKGKHQYRTYRANRRENNRVKKHKKKMDKLGKKRAKKVEKRDKASFEINRISDEMFKMGKKNQESLDVYSNRVQELQEELRSLNIDSIVSKQETSLKKQQLLKEQMDGMLSKISDLAALSEERERQISELSSNLSITEQQAKITAIRASETIEDLTKKLEAQTQSDRGMWKKSRSLQQTDARLAEEAAERERQRKEELRQAELRKARTSSPSRPLLDVSSVPSRPSSLNLSTRTVSSKPSIPSRLERPSSSIPLPQIERPSSSIPPTGLSYAKDYGYAIDYDSHFDIGSIDGPVLVGGGRRKYKTKKNKKRKFKKKSNKKGGKKNKKTKRK